MWTYYRNGQHTAGLSRYDGPRTRGYRYASFLKNYPVPPGFAFNYNSFMGSFDPHGGKYFVKPQQLKMFLSQAWSARKSYGSKLCLSENYNKRAYRWAGSSRREDGAARTNTGVELLLAVGSLDDDPILHWSSLAESLTHTPTLPSRPARPPPVPPQALPGAGL